MTIAVPRSGSTHDSAQIAPATSRNGRMPRRSRVICGRSASRLRAVEHQRDLGDLRRLDLDRPERDPALRAVGRGPDHLRDQQQARPRRAGSARSAAARVSSRCIERSLQRDQAERAEHQRPLQVEGPSPFAEQRGARAGAEDHHDAERRAGTSSPSAAACTRAGCAFAFAPAACASPWPGAAAARSRSDAGEAAHRERLDQLAEALAALLVVAEGVEAGAGGGEQDGLARAGRRRGRGRRRSSRSPQRSQRDAGRRRGPRRALGSASPIR